MTVPGGNLFHREIVAARSALVRVHDQHRTEVNRLRKHGTVLCEYLKGIAAGKKFSDRELRPVRRAIEIFTQ